MPELMGDRHSSQDLHARLDAAYSSWLASRTWRRRSIAGWLLAAILGCALVVEMTR